VDGYIPDILPASTRKGLTLVGNDRGQQLNPWRGEIDLDDKGFPRVRFLNGQSPDKTPSKYRIEKKKKNGGMEYMGFGRADLFEQFLQGARESLGN